MYLSFIYRVNKIEIDLPTEVKPVLERAKIRNYAIFIRVLSGWILGLNNAPLFHYYFP